MTKQAIGFIGLGQMGVPMAQNLLKAGHQVIGFDLNPQVLEKFSGNTNFELVNSPEDIPQKAHTIILMLPDSSIVDSLLWGTNNAGGLAHQLTQGSLLIDMGSSKPVCSKVNHQKLKDMGIAFVDAPVSGGVKRAIDGSLAIMIGGDKPDVDRALPTLESLGKTLIHVGTAGAGHAVKALNNYVSASGLLAVCVALVAAEKFGVDAHLVNQVFNASTGKNNTTDVKVENFMLSGKFNSGFALALMRKDLQTAHGFIEEMGTPGNFALSCLQTWLDAEKSLEKGADHTAMYQHIQK